MDGKMRSVWISQRDFRSVQGLMVPYLYETAIDGSPHPHRMVIESVTVNRTLDNARFAKPQVLVAASPPAAPANPAPSRSSGPTMTARIHGTVIAALVCAGAVLVTAVAAVPVARSTVTYETPAVTLIREDGKRVSLPRELDDGGRCC